MSTNFGGNFPAVRKVNQRDKLMFLAVVGLLFSLVLLIVLFSNRDKKTARVAEAKTAAAVTAEVGTLTLYAASKRITSGSKLSNFKFKPVYWPRNSIPEGAVRDLAELRGMYAKKEIPSGMPIQRTHLTKQAVMESLQITPGMRAVTIAIDATRGVEGWAQPGARVDVVLTYNTEGELKSKVIVENARVLSLGGDSRSIEDRGNRNRSDTQQRTITLEVAPPDALEVQTSIELGKISLIMRAQDDNRALSITEVGTNSIAGGRLGSKARKQCNNGKMRVGGQEYIIDCDGTLIRQIDPNEP